MTIVKNPKKKLVILKSVVALNQDKGAMAVRQTNKPHILFKKSPISYLNLWMPVLACMGFIFYASSIPGKDIPPLFPFQEILFHAFIYGLLAYFFSRALKKTNKNLNFKKIIYFTVAFGIIYGLSDEFHQMFVPNRCASGFDIFIDGIGSFIGSVFVNDKN